MAGLATQSHRSSPYALQITSLEGEGQWRESGDSESTKLLLCFRLTGKVATSSICPAGSTNRFHGRDLRVETVRSRVRVYDLRCQDLSRVAAMPHMEVSSPHIIAVNSRRYDFHCSLRLIVGASAHRKSYLTSPHC